MRKTYCKIVNGEVADQQLFEEGQTPEGETWLPVVVENPEYSRLTHHETGRGNRVEADRVVRYRVIEPIPVTPDMIKAECQRRIIAHCGAHDLTGALIKQMNNPGLKTGIDVLRAKSNVLEAMSPIPDDYRSDHYWS